MSQAEQLSNLNTHDPRDSKKTNTHTHTLAHTQAGRDQENLHIKSCKGQNLLAREAKAGQKSKENESGASRKGAATI